VHGVAEDFKWGVAGSNGLTPYYPIAGGVNAFVSYGLGNWWSAGWIVDHNGILYSAAVLVNDGNGTNAGNDEKHHY